jgi:hypothetical protein
MRMRKISGVYRLVQSSDSAQIHASAYPKDCSKLQDADTPRTQKVTEEQEREKKRYEGDVRKQDRYKGASNQRARTKMEERLETTWTTKLTRQLKCSSSGTLSHMAHFPLTSPQHSHTRRKQVGGCVRGGIFRLLVGPEVGRGPDSSSTQARLHCLRYPLPSELC